MAELEIKRHHFVGGASTDVNLRPIRPVDEPVALSLIGVFEQIDRIKQDDRRHVTS